MDLTRSGLQTLREREPKKYAGLPDDEVMRLALNLQDVPTEVLACELRGRGWIVRLER